MTLGDIQREHATRLTADIQMRVLRVQDEALRTSNANCQPAIALLLSVRNKLRDCDGYP